MRDPGTEGSAGDHLGHDFPRPECEWNPGYGRNGDGRHSGLSGPEQQPDARPEQRGLDVQRDEHVPDADRGFLALQPAGATASTISVSGVGGIARLSVNLSISHTWDSDLTATLTNPSGTTITLFSKVGANGHNFTNTTFDDQAAGPIGGGSAPFSGSYQPQQPLSTFSTQDANGSWTLKVSDGAAGDSGSLLGWSMSITSYTEPERLDRFLGPVPVLQPLRRNVLSPAGGSHGLPGGLACGRRLHLDGLGLGFADREFRRPADARDPARDGVSGCQSEWRSGFGRAGSGQCDHVPGCQSEWREGRWRSVHGHRRIRALPFSNLTPSQVYTVREVAPPGSTPTGTPTPSVQVGTNIDLSPQAGSQTETAVAIDPTDTNNIFVVSNTTNGTGLFASSSHDGGVTCSALETSPPAVTA